MDRFNELLGLPWPLAEPVLQAAKVSYSVIHGDSYNRFFAVDEKDWYVYRLRFLDSRWEVFLLHPMISSGYSKYEEV